VLYYKYSLIKEIAMNNNDLDWRKNPRKRWDRYRLEWHIAGNYSINAGQVKLKAAKLKQRVLEKTIKLLASKPKLDEIAKYRADWISLHPNGRTNKSATRDRIMLGIREIREEIEQLPEPEEGVTTWKTKTMQYLDSCIVNGFEEELEPPPKAIKVSKRMAKKLEGLVQIDIPIL
jgi:hypothetical protein